MKRKTMNSSLRRSAVVAAVFLCAVPATLLYAKLSLPEIQLLLDEGEKNFRMAMSLDRTEPETALDYYQKSIMHFERIINEGGIRNGRLYYNIGNAYFRRNDMGHAILNYKRAAMYMPNDHNLEQNLEFARSRRIDSIEKKQREKVFKTLFFLHYDVPSGVRSAIFGYSFALVWILAAILLFVKHGGIRIALIIACLVSAIFLASLIVESVSLARRQEGVIVTDEVVARKGDAETYEPSFTEPLHAGTEFVLLTQRTGWWHVELENGARCWLPSGSSELVLD